ncbi:mandelate racemase/muconate lactonizing enzyme family protein [Roseateles noduli]|uniref:mandelate racemase/muconate lactonizing enzyme family protein n=1 Tax=Roseateles noduli TaxID=2052484 RepID=UPI003D648354
MSVAVEAGGQPARGDWRVARVETYIVTVPRTTPYLGPLGPGESVNARGYIVRRGNGAIYPTVDRSVVVKVTAANGCVGWGETYGICAPRATCEIVNDLLAPVLDGRDPEDVEALWDELYGLMRVRGSFGGHYVDAIAALDIALWDLRAQARGVPLRALLGPVRREEVPGYLSGLPGATIEARVAMALDWHRRGVRSFKFAGVVSHEGIAEEFNALREALGDDVDLMVDLHWKFDAPEAIALAERLAPCRPRFIEAPVKPEDIAGLRAVCAASPVPVAAGEEWGTAYEARHRLEPASVRYLQPEMGHTGVTQFLRIAAMGEAGGAELAPHATIGVGIFLAASLHASCVAGRFWKHEWQHSIFERCLRLLTTDMTYHDGRYWPPSGPGLGVSPSPAFMAHAELVT